MLGSTTENSLAVGLGGPIIGVKAYVETLVERAPTTIPASPTNDYSVTQSVGVEGVIGLDLHFQVGEYEDQLVDAGFADLVAVYSRKYPLDNSVFSTQKTTGRRLKAVDSTQLQTAEDIPISDIRVGKRQSLEVLANGDSTHVNQQQQQRKLVAATLVPAFARSGSVYQGDMDILKEPEEYPECIAAIGEVFPAYMSMFAQVTGFTLNTAATPEDGWTFKLVIGASYGEQDFDNTAYAAYSQALYLMNFQPLTLPENDPTCQFVLTVGANGTDPAVPLQIQDSPPVSYTGSTSTTATALPPLYGQFCDSTGQTMVITDANGCYSVILSNEYLDPNEENNRRNNQQNAAARRLSASDESHPLHAKQIAARRLSTRRALGEGCFPQLPTDEELAEAALKKAKSGALTTAVFSTWTVAAAQATATTTTTAATTAVSVHDCLSVVIKYKQLQMA
eukprot:20388-Heterococcus_DN1.PRE.6